MKQFILITGMHRSGTSFLARAFNLAGVYLGDLESLTSHEWLYYDDNLKGHWENKKFVELAEKTLSQNNGSWHDIPKKIVIGTELGKEIRKYSEEIMNHISLASGFKDPRIILFLDAWSKYLPDNIFVVGIFRHPLKVAESLKKRDNFSYEKSLNLWKSYNENLLSILEKHNGFLLNFDWPKEKLFSELESMFDKLGLITNMNISEWYSEGLLISDKNYSSDYRLPDELITLYSKLRERSERNELVKLNKISRSQEEITKILHSLCKDIDSQGKYFKKINEENLTKIQHLQNSIRVPIDSLLKVYHSRPDLKKTFPEVMEGNMQNLLNWSVNTPLSLIGNEQERILIETNRPLYEYELEKIVHNSIVNIQREQLQQQESLISKITAEKQQQESLISKITAEKQQQEALLQRESSLRKELQSNLATAHHVVQEKENEREKLTEELFIIKNSVSWKLFLKIQHTLTSIFPSNTRRGNLLYLVLQYMRLSNTHGIKCSTKTSLDFLRQKKSKFLDQSVRSRIQLKNWKDLQNFNKIEISNMKKEIDGFKFKPKISIILPVYNIDKKWLQIAIDSVRKQIYENWELCIVDDASTVSHVKEILNEYLKLDPRIKIKFLEQNQNIAGASNEALGMVTGHYVGLLDHDDEIYQDALYEVAKAVNKNQNLDIIYSDENHISPKGERIDPFFKPDYSPDLLMTCHYMVHLIVYKTSLLRELGGFRRGFDGSQDYDLVLRAVEKTNQIHHISKLLYGWRNLPTSTAANIDAKSYAPIAAKKALSEALERRKIDGAPEYISELGYFKINYNITKKPLVSIIITTRDRPDLLSRLLSSIEKKTTYENYEIIVVDHLSKTKEALEFFKSIKHKVIRYEQEFNIPNLFNFAEKHAKGEYLLTMNDDLEVIAENWIESMLGPCQREEVGIVGAQLIYPDASAHAGLVAGQTIQHAGVVLGIGGIAGHAFRHICHMDNGYFAFNKAIRNYSAVTGSCMMVKRDVYKKVNGYDPVLKVAYNDVDFCLRVRKEGYLVVYTPYAKLYHYEGASRGTRQPSDDAQIFVNRWKDVLVKRDPYYNVNLTLLREDFSLSFSGIPIEETPLALLMEIYTNRPDLQKSFPEAATGQYQNLISWAATYGSAGPKFGIPDDQYSHVLSPYQFWYEENSGKTNTVMEQKIV